MAIQIDTAKIQAAAADIAKINMEITEDFSMIDSAVKKMRNSWRGSASDYSDSAIKHIEQAYKEMRFASVNQLVSFLRAQVSDSYETVESSAVSAADAFK